jgi:DNA-binding MarR family transcriptional regulator
MKAKLSFEQNQVLIFLAKIKTGWVSAYFIAREIHKDQEYSSSWASPILMDLIKKGLVEWSELDEDDGRRYRISEKGKKERNFL